MVELETIKSEIKNQGLTKPIETISKNQEDNLDLNHVQVQTESIENE